MENKLTWVELKKIVARQTDLTEKEVNQILMVWLDEMSAVLQRGEELRLNGLGIFRIKKMKERKSVDVTTGEAIILPETERLTFMMAAGLEEQLRDDRPSRLEVGIDPIQKLSEQADEIVDLLEELGQSPKNSLEDGIKDADSLEDGIEDAYRLEVKGEEQEPEPEPKSQPKQRLWLTALITILVFIVLAVGAFFLVQQQVEKWLNGLRERAEMVNNITEPENTKDSTIVEEIIVEEDTIVPVVIPTPVTREYTQFITTEKMHKNSRLTWMAYRYYGKKELWVFIYDANKDHIKNPSQIKIGTPIRIPKLEQEVIDLASPEIQSMVKQMEDEFLGTKGER